MDARSKFFIKKIRKGELGLEIGPSHNPLVTKSDGYNIRIVDHDDKKGLIKELRKGKKGKKE